MAYNLALAIVMVQHQFIPVGGLIQLPFFLSCNRLLSAKQQKIPAIAL